MSELWVTTLGEVPYRDGVALQQRLRDARLADAIPDCLLLLEHPPVYTLGRRGGGDDLPLGEDFYRARGIAIERSDRGGQVTYHGPGQLVGYPIMRVRSVREYVATMERAIVAALSDEGIAARVPEDLTGVWAGDAKIASIGVHVTRRVTTHGFAVNVENDLEPFQWIVPCGIEGASMTSVSAETGRARSMSCFRRRMAWRFAEAFGLRQRIVSARPLHAGAVAAAAGTANGSAADRAPESSEAADRGSAGARAAAGRSVASPTR